MPAILDPLPLWPANAPELIGVAPQDLPTLQPHLIEGKNPTSAIVICPGGGYGMKAPHEGAPIAEWLNTLGISAFVLEYRVAPYRHPAPLQDARKAIRTVRERAAEWNIRPNRIGILGFSAGGHLAATAGTFPGAETMERPDALILCYPVITLGKTLNAHLGSRDNLLGPNATDEAITALSAELNVSAATPPTFLWHTADDAAVPVANALLFAEACARHQVPFALHVFPTGRHGLGLAPDNPDVARWTTLCADFLRQQGFAT